MKNDAAFSSLSPMSRRFAEFICRLAADESPELMWAAALLCRAAEQGHVCLDLSHAQSLIPKREDEVEEFPGVRLPEVASWSRALGEISVVGEPGEDRPLILSDRRLYLQRFWNQEESLCREIRKRAAEPVALADVELVRDGVRRLFGSSGREIDWQRVAAITALTHRFCVISGGPGTGKTSTVVKILALLLEQNPSSMRTALAAPTGKAAARLAESIGAARDRLDVPEEIRDAIPVEALTLHRLLGRSARKRGFVHDAENPLDCDLVIVDEASMVDLPLMAALFAALPPHARLILLGDRDQLASVETGAVLANICGPPREASYSSPHVKRVAHLSGDELSASSVSELSDTVVFLRRSYRFSGDSGIGALARAVNDGNAQEALRLLADAGQEDLNWEDLPPAEQMAEVFEPLIDEAFRPYLSASSAVEALARFDQFRFLCAMRRGPWGVEGLNRLTQAALARRGLIAPRHEFYRGRPILITGNDYRLALFNGDVGLIWPDDEAGGALRAFFPRQGGPPRALSPQRLPAHETVYAMTVHKSQGSEFDRVLLLLPDRHSELLTRELLYTAITRARHSVTIRGTREVFEKTVDARVHRHTGLMERLWGGGATPDA